MYEPPSGDKLGFNLTGFGYASPAGDKLRFDFGDSSAYQPPKGNQVGLNFWRLLHAADWQPGWS